MPQLNPAPWLATLLTTWLIFFTLLTMITLTTMTAKPARQNLETTTNPWTWPWY